MKKNLHIILVEDNPSDAELVKFALSEEFENPEFEQVDSKEELLNTLQNFEPDLIVSDYSMPGFSGKEALAICSELKPKVPFIFVSGTIGEERAVDALKNGAIDYVLKSSLARLPHAAKSAIQHSVEKEEKALQDAEIKKLSAVVGRIDSGVIITDDKFMPIWINRACSELTGFSLMELHTSSRDQLFSNVNIGTNLLKRSLEQLRKGDSIHTEMKLLKKNGQEYWGDIRITPFLNTNGELIQIVSIVNDITPRKEAEFERDRLLQNLEDLVKERTIQLENAYSDLKKRNDDVKHSISYARYIQEAFIRKLEVDHLSITDAFVINLPRDVLSGDFHWQKHVVSTNRTYLVLGDCTGHGVPGSLMTMLSIQLIEQLVLEADQSLEPHEILHQIDDKIIHFLGQSAQNRLVNDGMEVMFICIDHKQDEILFSGAGRALHYFNEGIHQRYASPGYSVGGSVDGLTKTFTTQRIQKKPGDRLYVFSDGFPDQFGGPKYKKFGRKRIEDMLRTFQHHTIQKQAEIMLREFNTWKGDLEQIDDVLMMGVEL